MPAKKKIALFDFDGVIADSYSVAFEVNKAVLPGLTEDVFRGFFDGNINDWGKGAVSANEIQRIRKEFFEKYLPRIKEVKMFPGIKEAITKLEKLYTLIVISSTITSPIREFMERYNMAEHFDEIMGNDVHTSKVEKAKMVFKKYGVGAPDCVFITDTLGDMREASLAGVRSIGVTWGFHKKDKLLKGNPFCIIEKPEDLNSIVCEYLKD